MRGRRFKKKKKMRKKEEEEANETHKEWNEPRD